MASQESRTPDTESFAATELRARPPRRPFYKDPLSILGWGIALASVVAYWYFFVRKPVPKPGQEVARFTAAHYGIPIVQEDVQNSPGNITRFVRIAPAPVPCPPCTKCSLLIDPHAARPGLLHDLLGVFSARGINLPRIESRPSKRGMGSYVFFIDFQMATERLSVPGPDTFKRQRLCCGRP